MNNQKDIKIKYNEKLKDNIILNKNTLYSTEINLWI